MIMRKGNIKKILALFVAAVMLTCSFGVTAGAKSTTQMRSEISDLEQKSKSLESKIAKLKKEKSDQQAVKSALQEQIDNTQQKIEKCTALINSYKSEISEYENKINEKQKEIEATKFLFKKRMRSIYMSGSANNDLLVLMDAESFSDYLALSEVSKTISAHDKKIVNTITTAISEINSAKAAISEKVTAQNSVKQTLANEQARLKSQQSEINGVIASISSNQSALEKENKSYESAIASLEKEIQEAIRKAELANKSNQGSGGSTGGRVFVSGRFTWPVPGYYNITSGVGPRWGTYHKGIDIASAGIRNKPIVAAADGTVIAAGFNRGGYGNWVMINHGSYEGKNYVTVYGHMISAPVVSAGQSVKAGQHIGNVGSTGDSTGNHCHFEIRVNGSAVNPLNYFSRAK